MNMRLTKGFKTVANAMESIDLTKARHQLVTLPAVWLFAIFLAAWTGKAWVANAVGLTPVEAHKEDIRQLEEKGAERDKAIKQIGENVTTLAAEIRITWAYQMLEKAEANLMDHLSESNHDRPGWEAEKRRLDSKVRLANEYKNCILGNGENCSVIQRQILQ